MNCAKDPSPGPRYARTTLSLKGRGDTERRAYSPGRTTRLILSIVKFCPPIESVGGLAFRSTLSTVPDTMVEIATDWPVVSLAEIASA